MVPTLSVLFHLYGEDRGVTYVRTEYCKLRATNEYEDNPEKKKQPKGSRRQIADAWSYKYKYAVVETLPCG